MATEREILYRQLDRLIRRVEKGATESVFGHLCVYSLYEDWLLRAKQYPDVLVRTKSRRSIVDCFVAQQARDILFEKIDWLVRRAEKGKLLVNDYELWLSRAKVYPEVLESTKAQRSIIERFRSDLQ